MIRQALAVLILLACSSAHGQTYVTRPTRPASHVHQYIAPGPSDQAQ
jgi:hypothetical protein